MNADVVVLMEEIRRISRVVDDLETRLSAFRRQELPILGRSAVAASYVGHILENTYTALETIFLRISQYFENSLASDRWHADLLDKMGLHITDVRERVLEDQTRALLGELLRFRHFRRYYFEMDYDWHRLDYLTGVHERAVPLVRRDLERFLAFLGHLAS